MTPVQGSSDGCHCAFPPQEGSGEYDYPTTHRYHRSPAAVTVDSGLLRHSSPGRDVMDLDHIYHHLRGRLVILDLASPYVYIGTLTGWDSHYLHLEDADVHDLRDTKTTREVYLVEAKRLGINVNRKRVMVRNADVVSISALDDVIC